MASVVSIDAPSTVEENKLFQLSVYVEGEPEGRKLYDDFNLKMTIDGNLGYKEEFSIPVGETRGFNIDVALGHTGEHQLCAEAEDVDSGWF